MFRAGICPDCGAGIFLGMTQCKVCDLTFEAHAHELPPQKAKAPAAAPPQAASPAQPQQPPAQQYQQPPAQQQYQQPPAQQQYQQPPPPQQAQGSGGRAPRADGPRQASMSPIPSAQIIGKPLTADDIDLIERGSLKPSEFPLTDAEGPEYIRGDNNPLLGSNLQRAAIVVMADAAICDDPLVLMGHKPVENHVARAIVNYKRSFTSEADDPPELMSGRALTGGNWGSASSGEKPSARSAHAAESALPSGPSFAPTPSHRPEVARPAPDNPSERGAPPVAVPRAAVLSSAQGLGKPLSFEEMERIERPILAVQPHSYAEATDFVAGKNDPLLGSCSIKGANAFMADAAIIDDPLVLLGYPPVVSHITRQAINLKRTDAGICDDVSTLLQRNVPKTPTAATAAPAAAAPAGGVQPSGRSAKPADPDATAMLDNSAVMAAAAAVAREEEAARAAANRRPGTAVSGRGGARTLDDK